MTRVINDHKTSNGDNMTETCPSCDKPGGWVDFRDKPPGLYHLRCGVKAKTMYAAAQAGKGAVEISADALDSMVADVKRKMKRLHIKNPEDV